WRDPRGWSGSRAGVTNLGSGRCAACAWKFWRAAGRRAGPCDWTEHHGRRRNWPCDSKQCRWAICTRGSLGIHAWGDGAPGCIGPWQRVSPVGACGHSWKCRSLGIHPRRRSASGGELEAAPGCRRPQRCARSGERRDRSLAVFARRPNPHAPSDRPTSYPERGRVIRVLIAAQSAIAREGLETLLKGDSEIRVAGSVDFSGLPDSIEEMRVDVILADATAGENEPALELDEIARSRAALVILSDDGPRSDR